MEHVHTRIGQLLCPPRQTTITMRNTTHQHASRKALASLLGLVLLVNLAMSLYQLPLNRVIERRLCREYYAAEDPTVFDPNGEVSEELCKVDDVQKELAWIQGAMETAWIVGGLYSSSILHVRIDRLTCLRLRHDDTTWFHGQAIRSTKYSLA
jgi:hypothetical protein